MFLVCSRTPMIYVADPSLDNTDLDNTLEQLNLFAFSSHSLEVIIASGTAGLIAKGQTDGTEDLTVRGICT